MCKYEHCDSCGCRVNAKARMMVESLPCDVASGNAAGGSAQHHSLWYNTHMNDNTHLKENTYV